jgi:Tfp pilus assembly protein PilF
VDEGREEEAWRAAGGVVADEGCLLMAGAVSWQSGGVMAKKRMLRKTGSSAAETSAPPIRSWFTDSQLVRWMALACGMLCAGLYGWTADFPMTFDDCYYMKDNPFFAQTTAFAYLADFRGFAEWPVKLGTEPDLTANMLLRPLAYATFYLNHGLDGFEPRWFRVVNIAVHAANGWLILVLLLKLGRALEGRGLMSAASVRFIAVSSALVFLAHPLAVESVTYIVQRFTSMGAFWVLLCLVLHFKAVEAAGWRRHGLKAGAVAAALLGMLTKEDVVVVPLLAVGLDWLVVGTRLRTTLWRAVPLLVTLPAVPVMVMAVSAAQNGGEWSLGQAMHIVNLREKPWGHWQYVITQWTVIVEYLRMIVWPSGQNLYPQWPVYQSVTEGPVLRAAALLLGMFGVVGWLRGRRWMGGQGRLVFAFVLWFFGTVSVSSGLVPLPDMMAEHRSYLPSIGVLVALVCVVDRLRQLPGFLPGPLVTGVAVFALSLATCLRNEVWRTDVTLWEDTVAKSPAQFGAWNNLGAAYAEAGDFESAEKALRKCLEIEPRYLGARCNLSSMLIRLKRWQECYEVTMDLLNSNEKVSQNLDLAYNVGLSLAGMGRHEESAQVLEQILQKRPNHFFANKVLGMLHHHLQHPRRARQYLSRAETVQPGDPDVSRLLASLDTTSVTQ